MRTRWRALLGLLLIFPLASSQQGFVPDPGSQFQQPFGAGQQFPQGGSQTQDGPGRSPITEFEDNLVAYGDLWGDRKISDNQRTNGKQIRLNQMFPFYGGRYNYTMISPNGYISFAYFSDDHSTPKIGLDADWPTQSDPAIIAPYLCRQRIQESNGVQSYVSYRIEHRKNTFVSHVPFDNRRVTCQGKNEPLFCDKNSDDFLDSMQRALQHGVAGASAFRAESALVVTWKNLRPNLGSESGLSTYQLIWMTDAQGLLSYTMINYYKLGFDAADMQGNSRTGKCQAVFNGGNHTGSVMVDLSEMTKQQPSSLSGRSSIPHVARGRYVHRVDDVVRPAGCSNKTGGTFPLLIYPNIVSMLGETKVEINGLCLNPSVTYVLMIEQRQMGRCEIVNPSIARCTLPKVLDWGTKTVYFQPQSGLSNDEKAYVGFIYFVPPTIDPMRLDIGDVHSWFTNPPPESAKIKWYPRNFTQPRVSSFDPQSTIYNYFDDSIYNVQLGLYVVGYKEAQDRDKKKFVPKHRVLARLTTYQNRADEHYRWNPIIERYDLDHVDEWYLTYEEMHKELYTYRFGYLKLAPVDSTDAPVVDKDASHAPEIHIKEGMVSSPISLHWLWTLPPEGAFHGNKEDKTEKRRFTKKKAQEMCHSWFDEDGALENFIRETETNSSCPCKEAQAKMDIGRFMPHPRCSSLFRDVSCTETLGSMNCYMSAQNVHGSMSKKTRDGMKYSNYATHYGQTCCYDAHGYLMQSTYQPVIKIDESTPYSPGYPSRAYEMGSEPFQGMFEVPGLSSFHHDIMPYYLCCKYSDFRCQMFYWRRPSSACQAYEPAVTGSIMGAGTLSTLNNRNIVFNEPGIFSLLHSHRTGSTPEVQIQVRMERFPDRSVDFGSREIEQKDLVQPTNTTVVTGVVLQSDGADRVHVLLRKDTRRGRYKTSIIVGNVIRYFDNMHLQRFRGVTVYVNNVEKGQAEIYVVLDNAQIGMKIRESYAIDIDRKFNYMESLGLLDVMVSIPPQYKSNRALYGGIREPEDPVVEGLINPFPDEVYYDSHSDLQWSQVNDGGTRQQLLKYMVKGEFETQTVNLHADDVNDLFAGRNDMETVFQAFADHYLKGPVYKVGGTHLSTPFLPQTESEFKNFINFCKTYRADPEYLTLREKKIYKRCPNDLASLEVDCGTDVSCLFDAVMLQARLLGDEARDAFHYYASHRIDGAQKYNSCGAMNIEYPEYLIKGPSSGEAAYLEGNQLSFSCFQTHIIKGNIDFSCRKVQNEHDNTWRMQWTMGEQPWCRHRVKDNVFSWILWTGIAVGIILIPILIFTVCWTMKQKHLQQKRELNQIEMTPLRGSSRIDEKPAIGDPLNSSIATFESEPRSSTPATRFNQFDKSPYRQPIRAPTRPGELSV